MKRPKKPTTPLSAEDQRLADLRAELAAVSKVVAAIDKEADDCRRAYEANAQVIRERLETAYAQQRGLKAQVTVLEDARVLANPLEGLHLVLLGRASRWGTTAKRSYSGRRSPLYEAAECLVRVGLLHHTDAGRYEGKQGYNLTDAGKARLAKERARKANAS